MRNAIPLQEEPKKFMLADFRNSSFVEIKNNDRIEVDMQYPEMKMTYAEKQCFVREEVYDMLLIAAGYLPRGYKLKIWDAWRPFLLQKELYQRYSLKIIEDFELQDCTESQKKNVIKKFVSEPVADVKTPPVHTTGGAVDVTITGPDGTNLDMGCEFDSFSNKTYSTYFELEKNELVRENRRLLYNVMTKAGFTNLPSEWWHFDFGDKFWGYYREQPAFYAGVFTKEKLNGIQNAEGLI